MKCRPCVRQSWVNSPSHPPPPLCIANGIRERERERGGVGWRRRTGKVGDVIFLGETLGETKCCALAPWFRGISRPTLHAPEFICGLFGPPAWPHPTSHGVWLDCGLPRHKFRFSLWIWLWGLSSLSLESGAWGVIRDTKLQILLPLGSNEWSHMDGSPPKITGKFRWGFSHGVGCTYPRPALRFSWLQVSSQSLFSSTETDVISRD